ncbi:MAG: hypothetical protein EOO03_17705 [Chitinophagaceae bacterium]|nr:MAG: hypothetical protein EOO03_17705 [Chitinophagaceae bacterium]
MQLLFEMPGIVFFFFVILIAVTGFVFWVKMIIEIAQSEFKSRDAKIVWLLITLLLGFVGALIYYFVGRESRIQDSYI